MSLNRTAVIVIILATISSVYFIKVYRAGVTDQTISFSAEPGQIRILSLDEGEAVQRLSLVTPSSDGRLVFQKVGDRQWRVAQPVDYPAESMVIAGMVSLMKLSHRKRPMTFDGLSERDFGFDAPRLTICVATNHTATERCLWVGSDAVIGSGAYAKWADESKYFLIDPNFISVFDKSLYMLRKKQIFTLFEEDVSSVELRSADQRFSLEREGKHWMMTKPSEAALGPEAVHDLMSELNSLYVKEFLDERSSEEAQLGLNPARRVIRVTFADGSTQSVAQGALRVGLNAYYAKTSDGETVVLIARGKLDHLFEAKRF